LALWEIYVHNIGIWWILPVFKGLGEGIVVVDLVGGLWQYNRHGLDCVMFRWAGVQAANGGGSAWQVGS